MSSIDVNTQTNKMKANDKSCMRELRGALPAVVYNYLHCCRSAKEIWETLKDKYKGVRRQRKVMLSSVYLN